MKLTSAIARYAAPHGLVKWVQWVQRFRRIGAPARYAASSVMRQAMLTSRIEHLPFSWNSELSVVVDIGANVGAWSTAIRRFLKVKRHFAVEPNPDLRSHLEDLRLCYPGMEVYGCAVGDRNSEVTLNVTRGSQLASLLLPVEQQSVWHGDMADVIGKYQVEVRTLDDLFHDVSSVDLLKLDVQGFERQVIAGGSTTLKRTCCLLVEFDFERLYEGDTTYRELANIVEGELGFGFWDMSPPERRHGRALWADACFVRPGSVARAKVFR